MSWVFTGPGSSRRHETIGRTASLAHGMNMTMKDYLLIAVFLVPFFGTLFLANSLDHDGRSPGWPVYAILTICYGIGYVRWRRTNRD
jgi:hypothetical protein